MDIKVTKIGWDDENTMAPIILLDRKTRKALDVDIAQLVNVTFGAKKAVAIVQVQFAEFIGKGTTLGSLLKDMLNCDVDCTVTVEKAENQPTPRTNNRITPYL